MRDRMTRVLGWTKKRAWLLGLLLVLLPLSQHRIHGQILPDPCCPILSVGLGTIADLLRTVIGGPLDEIRGIQDEINRYQREVIWPQEAINRARALVGTVTGMVSQLRNLIYCERSKRHVATASQLGTDAAVGKPRQRRPSCR